MQENICIVCDRATFPANGSVGGLIEASNDDPTFSREWNIIGYVIPPHSSIYDDLAISSSIGWADNNDFVQVSGSSDKIILEYFISSSEDTFLPNNKVKSTLTQC